MIIRFRLFNDGLGFRYEFRDVNSAGLFWTHLDELTQFALAGDTKSGGYLVTTIQMSIHTTPIRALGQIHQRGPSNLEISAPTYREMMRSGTHWWWKQIMESYINMAHEAGLVDYSAMVLRAEKDRLAPMRCWCQIRLNVKAIIFRHLGNTTPWRTIIEWRMPFRRILRLLMIPSQRNSKFKSTQLDQTNPATICDGGDMHVGKLTELSDTTNLKLKDAKWSSLK